MMLIYIRKKISSRYFISQVKYDGHFAFILLTVMPQNLMFIQASATGTESTYSVDICGVALKSQVVINCTQHKRPGSASRP